VAFLVAMVGAYLLLVVLGSRGRAPTGDVVRMDFVGCDAAETLVRKRVEEMGLGEPRWEDTPEGFSVTARLPSDPSAERIPTTLATPGSFEVRAGEEKSGAPVVDATGIESAVFRLDLSATPTTAVQLGPKATKKLSRHMRENPGGSVSFWVDGAFAGSRKNDPPAKNGRLVLETETDDPVEHIRRSAASALILNNGPLPCALTVRTEQVAPAD
jgi:hypothetical protein